jgi:archaellum component FlaC
MRYKQLIQDKLEQLDNTFHQLNGLISRGQTQEAREFIEGMREKIADVQTLLNTEN